MAWYYVANEQPQGPMSDEEVAALIAAKTITGDTLVWTEGMDNWVPARITRLAKKFTFPPSLTYSSQTPTVPFPHFATTRPRVSAPKTTGRSILITTIGLAIVDATSLLLPIFGIPSLVESGYLYLNTAGWFLSAITLILNSIGGLIIALALRGVQSSIRWTQILTITVGWSFPSLFIGVMMLYWIFPLLWGWQETLGLTSFHRVYAVVNGGTSRAVGGLIIGFVLRGVQPSVRWTQVFIIAAGWAFSAVFNTFIFPIVVIGEAIGSSIMFTQLAKAMRISVNSAT